MQSVKLSPAFRRRAHPPIRNKTLLDISGRQMTDEKGKQTGLDNDFVSLEEPWQLHYWTTKLKCTRMSFARRLRKSEMP
jgi:hypothetical protein